MPRVKTPVFVAACATLYAVGALVAPRAFPLVEPDSAGYIEFSNVRTAIYPAFLRIFGALGLGLEQITYVQLALFVLSLATLVAALLRAGMPRVLIVLMVVGLLASFHLPSYHWTIMTESIFISVSTIGVAFWLDYFRTGRIQFLAAISLCVGLLIAIRPAGVFSRLTSDAPHLINAEPPRPRIEAHGPEATAVRPMTGPKTRGTNQSWA